MPKMPPSKKKSSLETRLVETFHAFLQAHGMRKTQEREAILGVLSRYEGHFRPEEVALDLKRVGSNISVVTVYRNLPVFVEAGILRRTCLSGRETRYEIIWERDHHDHLICTDCGKVVEFHYEAIEVLQDVVASQYGFTIRRHHLELVGLCSSCAEVEGADAQSKSHSNRKGLQ